MGWANRVLSGAFGRGLNFSRTFARFGTLSSLRVSSVPENRNGPFRCFSVPVPDRKTVSPYGETVSVPHFFVLVRVQAYLPLMLKKVPVLDEGTNHLFCICCLPFGC